MKKGLIGCQYDFSVDCKTFDTSININTNKYLMKKQYKAMFVLTKKMFVGLLTGLVNASNHTNACC